MYMFFLIILASQLNSTIQFISTIPVNVPQRQDSLRNCRATKRGDIGVKITVCDESN